MPQPVKVPVPAEYATVNKKVMVQPERAEWVQVLCDVNATPAKIQQVERALSSRGYPVQVDGKIDQQLTDSVRSFQQKNGLRVTGMMTAETLAKLGVQLK
jgi:peptidoglycan hydrolase-like protein with peptidoglycan-binding domain